MARARPHLPVFLAERAIERSVYLIVRNLSAVGAIEVLDPTPAVQDAADDFLDLVGLQQSVAPPPVDRFAVQVENRNPVVTAEHVDCLYILVEQLAKPA